MTFEPHCINSSLTIKDALVALNSLRDATLTLFVLNNNSQIIGTLTDGDIRRALVAGHGLDCTLDKVMHRDFKFIRQEELNVANLRSFRDRRIMFIPILDAETEVQVKTPYRCRLDGRRKRRTSSSSDRENS